MNCTTIDLERIAKKDWLRRNRGLLAAIARDARKSHEWVRKVYWGEKRSRLIEAVLRGHGAIVTRNGRKGNG